MRVARAARTAALYVQLSVGHAQPTLGHGVPPPTNPRHPTCPVKCHYQCPRIDCRAASHPPLPGATKTPRRGYSTAVTSPSIQPQTDEYSGFAAALAGQYELRNEIGR